MIKVHEEFENLDQTIDPIGAGADTFRADVLSGLAAASKHIPAKHLYDARGSRLFIDICDLPEYYLTRAEEAILEERGPEIASMIAPDSVIVEPGSGDALKTELLMHYLDSPRRVVLSDIDQTTLRHSSSRLARRFPNTRITPVHTDFIEGLPELHDTERVLFFPGSTIGNLDREERIELWRRFESIIGHDGKVLLGVDLVKDLETILDAYDDKAGLSAAFNANLLVRINNELGGDFNPEAFHYQARWNPTLQCVEMGQISATEQTVTVAGHRFRFAAGERLLIERSYKFTPRSLCSEAGAAGYQALDMWQDRDALFLVALFEQPS
jgi:dimethylhistidine N-methyltransferase